MHELACFMHTGRGGGWGLQAPVCPTPRHTHTHTHTSMSRVLEKNACCCWMTIRACACVCMRTCCMLVSAEACHAAQLRSWRERREGRLPWCPSGFGSSLVLLQAAQIDPGFQPRCPCPAAPGWKKLHRDGSLAASRGSGSSSGRRHSADVLGVERARPWDPPTTPRGGREGRQGEAGKKTADKARPRGCWEEEPQKVWAAAGVGGGCGAR